MAQKKITAQDVNAKLFGEVAGKIAAALEQGIIPWEKPWFMPKDMSSFEERRIRISVDETKAAYSYSTGLCYSGINQWTLPLAGAYATFHQISEAGGHVRKGEKAHTVVGMSYKWFTKNAADGKPIVDADGKEKLFCKVIVKGFNVFHVATQTEGVPYKPCKGIAETIRIPVAGSGDPLMADWSADDNADKVLQEYWSREGIRVSMEGVSDRAFYRPADDSITLPCKAQFKQGAEFYSTAFHESTHSTGHSSRLDRFANVGSMAFGSDSYSREELVAEIGAAAMCSLLGVDSDRSFRNSAAYCQSWAKRIKEEPDLIMKAAAKAESAVNYMLSGYKAERH